MLKFVIEMSFQRARKDLILNALHIHPRPHFIGLCKIVFAKRSFIFILVSCYFIQVSGDVNSAGKIVPVVFNAFLI